MSTFTQYAIAATEMALEDAAWKPLKQEELESTGVCLGSGIGNLDEIYATSISYEANVGSSTINLGEFNLMLIVHDRATKRYPRYLYRKSSST